MNRRKFIINTGLGAFGLYLAPSFLSCSNKNALNLDTILGQSNSLLSSANYLSKEGNNDFGYYNFDENNFTIEKYKAKQSYIFYKKSKIIGYTIQIEENNFFSKTIDPISKSMGKYKTNYKNDFGEELQWNNSGKMIKLSVNNFKDLPQLSFYSEFLEDSNLIL
jgi:hypothetical protein